MSDDRLYDLLPAIYRIRDAEQGEPLRALLALISEEMNGVEADITSLYENWFIETSDEWVVPYIGDLLGVRGLSTITSTAFSQRRYVANTLFYRRRKGTAFILEQLAKDVTGWPAHVVEFFEVLDWTQNVNHIRLFNTTPDLRATNPLNLIGRPFDSLPHTVDVRHINNRRGKHNIPNIGLFLWRLQNYPLEKATARQSEVAECGWHFSPLGNPAPLFNFPLGEGAIDEQTVPAPIRQVDFLFDLKSYADKFASDPSAPANSRYYGPARSVYIEKDGSPVETKDVVYLDLKNWSTPPTGKVAAVDVELGRMTFAPPARNHPSRVWMSVQLRLQRRYRRGSLRAPRASDGNYRIHPRDFGRPQAEALIRPSRRHYPAGRPPASRMPSSASTMRHLRCQPDHRPAVAGLAGDRCR